jgi:membrane fusion protein, multidrug efflux system
MAKEIMDERRSIERRSGNRRGEDRKKKSLFDPKYLLLLAAVGVMVLLWIRRDQEKEAAEASIKSPVRIVRPGHGNLEKVLTLNGYVESESMVTVLPKISGTLEELTVDIGDTVTRGQVIGAVDSEPYELNVRQAEAAYLAAKSTYERTKQLYDAQATSRQNHDMAKSQYDAAKSQYELARLNYQYAELTAPVEGVVLVKHASVGSLVAPQVPLVTIGDLENLRVKANIPENRYAFFAEKRSDMEVRAEVPALGGRDVSVRVEAVAPYISPESKSFETICTLTEDTGLVRPGMYIRLTFILEKRRDIDHLPNECLVAGRYLWYVDLDGCAARRIDFDPGFANEESMRIPEEYRDYAFIIEGQHFLKEGQVCRVLNEGDFCR